MDFKYLYITWVGYTAILWFIIYFNRKDLRKSIAFISVVFGFLGLLFEYIHLNDWWQPQTITGTKLGFEDFLGSFFVGGIATGIYEFLTNRYYSDSQSRVDKVLVNNVFAIFTLVLFLLLYFVFGFSSFYSQSISCLAGVLFLCAFRRDLIKNALISGLAMLIFGMISYPVLELIFPGFVRKFWFIENEWYHTLIFGIPVEEPIWWFFTGTFIGPLYKFLYSKNSISGVRSFQQTQVAI